MPKQQKVRKGINWPKRHFSNMKLFQKGKSISELREGWGNRFSDPITDDRINFWAYLVSFRLGYSPFPNVGFLYRNKLVNKIFEEPLKLGSLCHTDC